MSQRALLLAVAAQLRTVNAWTAEQCEVMFGGAPKPDCGEFFVAVHPGQWVSNASESLDEEYGVLVTVTRRVGFSPEDRMGTTGGVTRAFDGLAVLVEKVRVQVHMSYVIMNAANVEAQHVDGNPSVSTPINGFVEPLRFRDGGRPEPKGGDWFAADPEGDDQPVGLAQTLTFAGARRVQTLETMY